MRGGKIAMKKNSARMHIFHFKNIKLINSKKEFLKNRYISL